MTNFEEYPKNIEKYKNEAEECLTKEEIEKIIFNVEAALKPFYEDIKKIRNENQKQEIGGKIIDGKLKLTDESARKRDSVEGDLHAGERKLAEEGAISFHTHTDSDLTNESAQDILAAYYRFKEIIFHKDGVSLLIALKELPVEEIEKIDKQIWMEAQEEEEKCGDPAYWFWKSKLQEKLPTQIVDIFTKKR